MKISWAVLAILLVCLGSSPASAEAPTLASAEALFEAGLEAAKRGDFERAAELFLQSEQRERSPNTLLNLAITYGRLHRPLETLATLDALDELVASYEDEARKTKAEKLRARAEAEVARIDLTVQPADARVTIDGAPMPANGRLLPGSHTVRAQADGYQDAEWSLELAAGERRQLDKSLTRLSPRPSSLPVLPTVAVATRVDTEPGPGATQLVPAEALRSSDVDRGPRRRRWRVAGTVTAALVAVAGTILVISLTNSANGHRAAAPQGETSF